MYTGQPHRPRTGPIGRNHGSKGLAATVGTLGLGLILAALAGLAAGVGSMALIAPILMIVGLIGVALLPPVWLVWLMLVLGTAVVGPAVYFAKIESARWLTPMLGLALFIPLVIKMASPSGADGARKSVPGFAWLLGLFVLQVLLSTVLNESSLGEFANAPRYYLVIAPLTLLLMFGVFDPKALERGWRFLIWFTLIQLPVAAVQHFVYAARKVREASWDAVVGTYPGQSEGGGASHGLGVYMLTAVVFALALWRKGHLSGRSVTVLSLFALGTIALAEVKAVVLLIPVALALVFLDEVRKRPWRILIAGSLGLVLTVGVLSVYDRVFYQDARSSWQSSGAPESALEGVQNQLDPSRVTRFTPPSRTASFRIWWDENAGQGDIFHALMGYGAASTQANRIAVGKLSRKYPYPLYQTTTAMLLWESGLLGHGLLLLAVLMAAFRASRLARLDRIPDVHRALLHAAGVGLVLQALTFPYKSFAMLTAPSQILLAFLLGYVAYWARECSEQTMTAPRRAARARSFLRLRG